MGDMTVAATEALALHHDLLVELARIDMALDSLDAQTQTSEEKLSLRERLSTQRARITAALERLDA